MILFSGILTVAKPAGFTFTRDFGKFCFLWAGLAFLTLAQAHSAESMNANGNGFDKCLESIDKTRLPMTSDQVATPEEYDHVVCIIGRIEAGTVEKAKEIFGGYVSSDRISIIINSPGGDVAEGLKLGRLIQPFNTAVYAYRFCGSSCANYILPAGDKRVVLPDTLLMFHGGATLNLLEEAANEVYKVYQKAGLTGAEKNVEDIRKWITSMIKEQEDYLHGLGIDKHLFRWMDIFNHMSDEDKQKLCPEDPVMIVYDPGILAKFGYEIDDYRGPGSQKALERLLAEYGVQRNMCYWKHKTNIVE